MLFFVSTSLFSCVYVYNFGRAMEDAVTHSVYRYGPVFSRIVWVADPGLFTIIASHVSMSHIGALPLLCIDVIVTIGVIARDVADYNVQFPILVGEFIRTTVHGRFD
ncbi:hypothetical protein Pmar_PMAR002105 [Perkinsus marinus ATCC 50983]|uniref:Uncharacterized protein n=1 Tax=Perkinsus marinus (strain ATCC 50983 / TXsc) TaxID=423536 RepID=C5K8X0_PERM5|nr:hypothetical protein Pmar_PMAR002105 [Perkinsus marinus ATCC 50983]EER19074.1 hypothetical protein Pmar_PMAR002105 [Perkinsus marinus ATCC 50983]|eukprot:XP_002787278.1 hypothetical protein Pmar_PMAR002105 [Perkinsus marinus ATCC 50983]